MSSRCARSRRAVRTGWSATASAGCSRSRWRRSSRGRASAVALLALLDTPYPGLGRQFHSRLLRRVPAADRLARRIAYFARRLRYHLGVLRALPRGRLAYLGRMARVGAKGLDAPVSARRREALERRASYVGRLMTWKPAPLAMKIHLVESEEGRRRGFAAGWSRLSTGRRDRARPRRPRRVHPGARPPRRGGAAALARGERGRGPLRRYRLPHLSSYFLRFSS